MEESLADRSQKGALARTVGQGFVKLGFAQLGGYMAQANNNPALAGVMEEVGNDVVNVMRQRFWKQEADEFKTLYGEPAKQALAELQSRYDQRMAVNAYAPDEYARSEAALESAKGEMEDGAGGIIRPGIQRGMPIHNSDLPEPGISAKPGTPEAYEQMKNASTELYMGMHDILTGYLDRVAEYKNNPYIQDRGPALISYVEGLGKAMATGTKDANEQEERIRAQERHTSDMETNRLRQQELRSKDEQEDADDMAWISRYGTAKELENASKNPMERRRLGAKYRLRAERDDTNRRLSLEEQRVSEATAYKDPFKGVPSISAAIQQYPGVVPPAISMYYHDEAKKIAWKRVEKELTDKNVLTATMPEAQRYETIKARAAVEYQGSKEQRIAIQNANIRHFTEVYYNVPHMKNKVDAERASTGEGLEEYINRLFDKKVDANDPGEVSTPGQTVPAPSRPKRRPKNKTQYQSPGQRREEERQKRNATISQKVNPETGQFETEVKIQPIAPGTPTDRITRIPGLRPHENLENDPYSPAELGHRNAYLDLGRLTWYIERIQRYPTSLPALKKDKVFLALLRRISNLDNPYFVVHQKLLINKYLAVADKKGKKDKTK